MTNNADTQYLRVLRNLLDHGVRREGRNGVTFGLFGEQLRFDLSEGFPLLTTKKVHFHSIMVELLWFLRGDTNIKFLHDNGVTIWDEWADANGDLGPVYGKQWRSWPRLPNDPQWGSGGIDQIAQLLIGLKTDPYGRRHIVTAWNPAEIRDMALPPCHYLFQFNVRPGTLAELEIDPTTRYLDCHLYQRSADWFLGVPFNIASYALLVELVAREVGMYPGHFIHSFGDLHLYENHCEVAARQLLREPKPLPELYLRADDSVSMFDMKPEDIAVNDYDPWSALKAEVSK